MSAPRNACRTRRPSHYTTRYPLMRKWTTPLAERRTAARIEDAKAALHDILATWNEVDMGVVMDMEEQIAALDAWLDGHRAAVKEHLDSGGEFGR